MTFDGCQSQCQFNQFEIKSAKLIIVTVNMNSINSTQTIWQEKEEKTTRSMPNQIYLSLQNSKWTHGKCVWWKMWDAMRFGWNEFNDFSIYLTSSSGKCQKFGDLIERRDQFSIVVDVSYEFNFRYFERWRKKAKRKNGSKHLQWILNWTYTMPALSALPSHPSIYILIRARVHTISCQSNKSRREERRSTRKKEYYGKWHRKFIMNFPNQFFFSASLLFDILFVSVVFFFFLHFVKQGKGISIQHLIQYSEFGIEVKEYWSDIEAT